MPGMASACIACKICAGYTLLVMVFHKTQHVLVNTFAMVVPNGVYFPGGCAGFVTG
jgi:hypothetical protein